MVGSVLGPILFLIYLNDLPEHVKSQVRLFADDTALYLSLNKLEQQNTLQTDLDNLHTWELSWNMEFNPSKCQVIQISRSRKPLQTSYTLHGQTLQTTTDAKYLGITLTNKLTWDTHVNNITNKANKTLGFIKRNIKTRHTQTRETAYKTLVRPQLEYASCVWDPYTKDLTDEVERIQRRAARWCLNNFSLQSSVSDMLDKLEWQTLQHRRQTARLVMFHKIVYALVAIPIPDHYQLPVRTSSRNHQHHYYQVYTPRDYYKFSFFPRTIAIWNSLPCTTVSIQNLDNFRSTVSKVPLICP
ncbi:hypothetical protein FSP39_020186 [Pinctada imbricata]|uniref:Reverse transcriptase domain-containing protein n=1 Tax=Pinctada imbricata TaxID=66713 RepID=A0AA88YR19_PINIB|nr:hypothetical protein FSP39_020186 [Pinctada imbricata]